MAPFVDPRSDPTPPAAQPASPPADGPEPISDLIEHCRHGRIYAIERWIRDGRPLQATQYRVGERKTLPSPIHVALDRGNHDLALLLLCNGYDLRLERHSPLVEAIRQRREDFISLLITWGDDLSRIWPEDILGTYDASFIDRCWQRGVDYTHDDLLAHHLGRHANKPLLGWAKHHLDDERIRQQLAMALRVALWEGRERAIHLLLWAGADPLLAVRDLRWSHGGDDECERGTALTDMVSGGHGHLLKLVKLDDPRVDLSALCDEACDGDAIRALALRRPDHDWSKAILHNLNRLLYDLRDWTRTSSACLEALGSIGARLTAVDAAKISDLRRSVLRSKDSEAVRTLLRWMSDPRHCEPAIFEELIRTPAMARKASGSGFRMLTHRR